MFIELFACFQHSNEIKISVDLEDKKKKRSEITKISLHLFKINALFFISFIVTFELNISFACNAGVCVC
jgi:hypothetical protein